MFFSLVPKVTALHVSPYNHSHIFLKSLEAERFPNLSHDPVTRMNTAHVTIKSPTPLSPIKRMGLRQMQF